MYIYLKDSTIKLSKITAVAKSIVPETNFTPVFYTMVVYLEDVSQPLVHTYETEEARDEVFNMVNNALDASNRSN